jgi:DNA-binding protein YbaB
VEFDKTQLDKLQAEAKQRLEGYRRLREDMTEMATTARSEDRTVTVTVGPSGTIIDLGLTAQALRHGPDQLARLIMSMVSQAHGQAARKLRERVSEYTGQGPRVDMTAMLNGELPDVGSE